MGRNTVEKDIMNGKLKDQGDDLLEEWLSASLLKSPTQDGRASSMVIKKAHTVIPPHLVAEAISTLHAGLDLRWSGPITPSEMEYVQQYVFAKYPQYSNGLVEVGENKFDIDNNLSTNEESSGTPPHEKPRSPKCVMTKELSSFSFNSNFSVLNKTQLEPSRLLDILTKKSSFEGNFVSIPEVQARNRALKQCGLAEEDYLVLFTANYKDAMTMIGESYPFFRGNFYMSIINEQVDFIKEFAIQKESKVILAPETWLDLRIKGSQLSQYFRRKCKHSPKGLFSYPAKVHGTRYSMHWISEAHRNSWHVLLDVTDLVVGEDRIGLALHQPDFVLCSLNNSNTHSQPSIITCLLVRRKSFDTLSTSG
ncbi:hypothetical protein TorRG33x02_356070 [Trema orientale]|uniref:Pyridoxal phosphate-dependent transferase n=1 Tax=Trema orientale TaxID=63057 RepID=A0A2P5A818_TREOI|nr:hypothetical protein TorRG33x02_356070 [Trema orientale]